MLDKIKKMFSSKDKKIENLIFLLAILIITLICINYIMEDDEKTDEKKKYAGAVLASSTDIDSNSLEERIESILQKINGVGKVSVLLTYNEEELEGIVIVAEGASNLQTKVNIISAVEAVTGLGKHKIKVYEMKESGGNYGEENQYGES